MFKQDDKNRFLKTETEKASDALDLIDHHSEQKIRMKEIFFSATIDGDFFDNYSILIPESWETDLKNGRIFFGHHELHLAHEFRLPHVEFTQQALEQGYSILSEREAKEAGLYYHPVYGCKPESKQMCSPAKKSEFAPIEEILEGEQLGTCEPTENKWGRLKRFVVPKKTTQATTPDRSQVR